MADHAPKKWYLVVSDGPLVLSAGCTCGDDYCYWSATVYEAHNFSPDSVLSTPVRLNQFTTKE